MIYAHVAYREDANLGAAYNDFMRLLPDNSWACFLDHDALPTTGRWHAQFTEAIAFLPHAGAIVAMTNRCARSWQRCGDGESNDVAQHRQFGALRARTRTLLDVTETKGFGGVMFALNKAAWKEVGGFVEGALGCTDHSMHHRLRHAGRKVFLHEGIFVYHWRHWGGVDPTTLYPKAPDCECAKPEVAPSVRIALPC